MPYLPQEPRHNLLMPFLETNQQLVHLVSSLLLHNPITMQPNNPGAMLPQDKITLLDRFFPHATWIQNPGGYSKVVELMRHAQYRSLTQIGGGPFTKSNELAAVVRSKFVNDYRRTHGEAVFKKRMATFINRRMSGLRVSPWMERTIMSTTS